MPPNRVPYIVVLDLIPEEGEMYAEYLRATGFTVRVCQYPAEAFEAIDREPPDAVVTRLRQATPGVTGIDVVRRLKESAATSHVPVVMITSSSLTKDKRPASDVHCDAYMLLPVVPEQLAAEIRRLLAAVT